MTDTPPEIKRMIHERLMSLSGEQRFLMGAGMFESARRLVLASIPAGLEDRELRRRLFHRFYGRPLFPE